MRLYIIRHADPDYANDTITAQGHREAKALAERLAREGLTRLYSSPLVRARETMRYTQEATGLTPVIEGWITELTDFWAEHDPWGRLVAWDIPGEIVRRDETLPTHETWHQFAPFAGEGLAEHYARFTAAADAFVQRHGYERVGGRYRLVAPNRERIAIFCHNGSAQTWLAHLLAIPLTLFWSSFWLAPSSVTTVLFDERSTEWAVPRCLSVGDLSHLYAAGLPVQPKGILANFD